MIVYDNGVYREPTAEEIEAWEQIPPPEDSNELLNILLGGES